MLSEIYTGESALTGEEVIGELIVPFETAPFTYYIRPKGSGLFLQLSMKGKNGVQ